ncbi:MULTISPECIES: peptidoglycan DD-metalloendopeptidase family protein [unclassified Streptomyces]|uniref:peptidoglycan DD-metalloendopeptidase family protein n=1 Tax=unclassified Streptomyces TaxID=2593676 RepID=UPI0023D908F1|nr:MULTISPECIES: peptidoglycan DD-metalloendopeptidase family protein [unclassified Streptomyces]MCH0567264.1 peptidoglycan DD-metalloendopeptidase family protein [Streptomyces sp. MUM 2J]MCH0571866.1 peptidoglycan DD-metalloendopeptidase family protein [Streptomyces sp. MUM 136J]
MPFLPFPSRTARHAAARRRGPRRLVSTLALAGALSAGGSLVAAATATAAPAEVWDAVAACESGGDWSLDSGNGYFGGLQFQPGTWAEFGGHEFAENAHQATREQQITVAERVLAAQGPSAWPQCSLSAGLEPATAPATGTPPAAPDTAASAPPNTGRTEQPGTWAETGRRDCTETTHQATREQQTTEAERGPALQDPGACLQCPTTGPEPATTPATGTLPAAPAGAPIDTGKAEQPGTVPGTPTTVELGPAAPHSASRPAAGVPLDDLTVSTAYGTPGPWAAGYHTGVDFATPTGTPVKAVADGTVVSAGWAGAYGNAVVIQHTDGIYTLSAHLSSTDVTPGEHLTAGQQIGLSGNTGNSTGPHLHFEVRTSNTYGADIDPLTYLRSIDITI